MSTVNKALSVLGLFSESKPKLRASEIARLLGWDKSNVQRYVTDLAAAGLLEQDSRDKSYYLGVAVTRLAMVREKTHPTDSEVRNVMSALVQTTSETAHSSRLVGDVLMTGAVVETKVRGTRVYIDPAVELPIHATASGIAVLTGLPQERIDSLINADNTEYTARTPVSADEVHSLILSARQKGYAKMAGTYESDVVGIAAPVFSYDNQAIGAIAIATPAARFNNDSEELISTELITAAKRVSSLHGAVYGD